ncbi:hypothetical protein KOI35_19585 [Actinoplanes bogorensis]|uniref:SnoaL-like domain-containing protein n=1 Tax=Paractinoplanes bogorensis TaxID=1610840 RepID=A0ABS5YUG2_9ACTN|nr:hypothetical protein [Actinoplanes bogorensis]MBU2665715.1 hypothetical protein [Actinoplanes bogorensis]
MTVRPDEIPAVWCRMWSEDASLAHQLMTADARQWSGVVDALDPLIGPGPAEAFVRTYQRDVGNVFHARTLVIDGADRLAYTWDVTRPDGSVTTGADVCFLRDGRVAENWTLPSADGRSDLPDATTPTGSRLTRDDLLALTADAHPWHRERVVDVARQTVAGVWDDGERGGIAVLVVAGGRVEREWSIPGTRKLSY